MQFMRNMAVFCAKADTCSPLLDPFDHFPEGVRLSGAAQLSIITSNTAREPWYL
jgi:hypothetical protein